MSEAPGHKLLDDLEISSSTNLRLICSVTKLLRDELDHLSPLDGISSASSL